MAIARCRAIESDVDLGALVACIFVSPYVSLVSSLFRSHWPISEGTALIGGSQNGMTEGMMQVARAVVFWTAANYAFDRLLAYPRFRKRDAPAEKAPCGADVMLRSDGDRCGLLQRLTRINALQDIIWVKVEEHYVRVRAEHAEELVSYRFGLALKDLRGEDGFQVHRSYWVRQAAIARAQDGLSRLTLEMKDGSLVPVSRPYHALIRQTL